MTAYQRMYYYLDHAISEALRTAVTPPQSGSGRKKHTKSKAAISAAVPRRCTHIRLLK